MVVAVALWATVAFAFVASAAYVGTLRALEVYHDPRRDSYFLSNEPDRSRQ